MPSYKVQHGQIFNLKNGRGTPVRVLKVTKGQVNYYREQGTGVIHTLSEDDFLSLYEIDHVREAQLKFKRELEEILEDGN